MKDTIWNLLTILVVTFATVVGILFLIILVNPNTFLNPLPPPELPDVLVLPTATPTLRQLPDIVTPTIFQEPEEPPTATATLGPTWTPIPTNTSFVLPTATDTLTPTPTETETPTVTPTSSAYNCSIVNVEPDRTLPPGGDFDGVFTLRNVGTETWGDIVDFVFISGTRFQTSGDAVDLPQSVSPGNTVDIIVDMLAPREPGTYETTWALRRGDIYFCEAELTITVR